MTDPQTRAPMHDETALDDIMRSDPQTPATEAGRRPTLREAAKAVLLELDIIRKHREDTGASSLLIVHPMTHADLRAAIEAQVDPEEGA